MQATTPLSHWIGQQPKIQRTASLAPPDISRRERGTISGADASLKGSN
jgi:hypothetical protein